MPRKLIINADDYGYVNHIDDAIVVAAKSKRVSAVSCFSNMPKNEMVQKIDRLKTEAPEVGFGLHLTITSGKPLTNCPSLRDKKHNAEFKECNDYVLANINKTELKAELRAQFEQFIEVVTAAKADHVSCHHNILNLNNDFFEIYADLAAEFDLKMRSPRRSSMLTKFNPVKNLNPTLIPPSVEEALKVRPRKNFFRMLYAISRENVDFQEKLMVDKEIKNADYFLINIYGNADLDVLKTAYPIIESGETCEQIMHLSRDISRAEWKSAPNGINNKYFEGRNAEFRLIMSKAFGDLLEAETNAADNLVIGRHKSPSIQSPPIA